ADALFASLKIMVHQKATHEHEIPVVKTIATEGTGIAELAAAIDIFFAQHHGHTEHKVHLMTEKCWQILQAERMKGLDKKEVYRQISGQINQKGFNLYSFAKKMLHSIQS